MNIRQIRNTIFTFAKPERQTMSHSSGQLKHSRSVTRAATRASHLSYHCFPVFPSFFSAVIHPIHSTPILVSRRTVHSTAWCLLFMQTNRASVGHFACTKQWRIRAVLRKLDTVDDDKKTLSAFYDSEPSGPSKKYICLIVSKPSPLRDRLSVGPGNQVTYLKRQERY